MKLNLEFETELQILEKYQITPTELFVTRLILIAQDSDEDKEYLARFLQIPGFQSQFRDILISLQDKGVIKKSYTIPQSGKPFVLEDVEFNSNFVKNVYRDSGDMGDELFEHYPQFGNINGGIASLRNVSKKFVDLEDAWRKYGKIIKWNPDTHNEIIELLDWARDNNASPNKSLANFICDHSWLDLKALRDGGLNINYDSVKIL